MKKSTVKTNYEFIPIDKLQIDKYQRTVKMQKVRAMAEKFDETLLGTITVSRREGKIFVIDGQHRVLLAKLMNLDGLMALVYEGLAYEEEAKYFNKLNGANGEQIRLSTSDIFDANVEAKDKTSLEIKEIVESVNFKIAKASGNNNIVAINTIIKIYKKHGGNHLFTLLKLIRDTWGGESNSLNNLILSGVSEFLKVYITETNFSTATFVRQLSKVDPIKIIRESKADTTTDKTNVKTMNSLFKYYNYNLKSNRLTNEHYVMF